VWGEGVRKGSEGLRVGLGERKEEWGGGGREMERGRRGVGEGRERWGGE